MHKATTTFLSLLFPFAALAQSANSGESPAAGQAAEAPPWYRRVTFGGMVDAFYQVRANAAQDISNEFRVFDQTNGLNLSYAKLSAVMEQAPAGFRIDLGFGPAADVISGASGPAKYVQQAYAAMLLGPMELDVGRFVTSAGAEVIEAKDNWMYSRSLLFGLLPFTHVGARASIPLTTGLTLTLGVNNGWDVVLGGHPGKTGQVSVAYSGPFATCAVNVYSGVNPTTWAGVTSGKYYRTLIDAVLGTSLGAFDFNLSGDWSTEAADTWYGGAVMARYHFPGEVARLGARGEVVRDQHGVRFATGKDTIVSEATLSLAVPVGSGSELRLEGRLDHCAQPIFLGSGAPTGDQATATLAALAWF